MKIKTAERDSASRFGADRLYRDAASVGSSSVANAALGIGFWGLAAHIYPPDKLGVMTAVLAVITSTGVVVAAGVGDAFAAFLPAVGTDIPRLYRRGRRLSSGLALVSGVVAALAAMTLLTEVRGSLAVGALVVIGIMVWSAFGLQNSTLVALGRARWLPASNIAVNLGKIAMLPLLAITLKWQSVELSFVIAAAIIGLVLRYAISRVIDSGSDVTSAPIPASTVNRTFDRFVAQTISSSALGLGLLMVTPFLVTVFAGPRQGALFALAFSVVQALDLIGVALTVSLVVHASSAPKDAHTMARAVLIRAVSLATVGGLGLIALAPVGLRLLNPEYGAMGATGVIATLCLGAVVRTVYAVWNGLQNSRRNMRVPLAFQCVFTVLLLAALPVLCGAHGALGGAFALLLAQVALSAGAAGHYLITRHKEWSG